MPTLTVPEILSDVLDAFKTRTPGLNFFSTDFSSDQAKYGQQVIAHLPQLPTAYDHSAANGYSNNAQNARDLLEDVPITINAWKDVPIKIAATDASSDRSQNYLKTIANAGFVLGKSVVDTALAQVLAANFSDSTTETIANTDKGTLTSVRKQMNVRGTGTPRYGLVNTDFASALGNDQLIASGDYHGQQVTDDPYASYKNIEGFAEIKEYPAFPANGQNLSAFFFDPRAVGIATRLPVDSSSLAAQLGIPSTVRMETIQDPETGLALAGFAWMDDNTHDIFVVTTVMFGVVAGAQGGTAGTKTDYAGHRVVTA